MHSFITSYLLQSKECILPGIGVLQVILTPAATDGDNHRILPPCETIIFKRENHSASPGLIKYIAEKNQIDQREAKDLLDRFCREWKEKINAGDRLSFETIGSIQKNAEGVITFEKEKSYDFFQPIIVDKVYQRKETRASIEEEPVLPVVDEYEINEYKEEEPVVVERSYWGLWAIILIAIASVILFYHFKDHKPSTSNIGNQHKYIIDSAGSTYQLPK